MRSPEAGAFQRRSEYEPQVLLSHARFPVLRSRYGKAATRSGKCRAGPFRLGCTGSAFSAAKGSLF